MPFGHPCDRLNVAQAARPRLDVGLEVVGRVVCLQMPLSLLTHLGLEELLHGPDVLRTQRYAHGLHQLFIAREQPSFDQRRHNADIAGALLSAFFYSPDAMSDLQSNIPEESNETLHHSATGSG